MIKNRHQARVALGLHTDRALDIALASVLLLHGPIDVLFTTSAWHLESNPATLAFGVWAWVAVKIGALALPVFVWWFARVIEPWHRDSALFFFGLWSGGALAVVVLNLFEMGVLPP